MPAWLAGWLTDCVSKCVGDRVHNGCLSEATAAAGDAAAFYLFSCAPVGFVLN